MVLVKNLIRIIFKIISLPNIFFCKKNFKKIIFLHIPHCGGNTIHRFLKYNFGFRGNKIITDNNNKISKILEDGKDNFYNFGHFGFDFIHKNFNDKSFFYLLNVRNPKNIYLSNYYRDKKYNAIGDPGNRFPSLEEFLKNKKKSNRDNILCRYLSGLFIYKNNETIMTKDIYENAVKNLDMFKSFFIIENSNDCLRELPKKLNIKLNYAKIFYNKANKHSNSEYPVISEEAKEILESMTYYDNKLYKIIIEKNKNF